VHSLPINIFDSRARRNKGRQFCTRARAFDFSLPVNAALQHKQMRRKLDVSISYFIPDKLCNTELYPSIQQEIVFQVPASLLSFLRKYLKTGLPGSPADRH
jgi:hypothetical protein